MNTERLMRGLVQAAVAGLGQPPVRYRTSDGAWKTAKLEAVNNETEQARVLDSDAIVVVSCADVEIILAGETDAGS